MTQELKSIIGLNGLQKSSEALFPKAADEPEENKPRDISELIDGKPSLIASFNEENKKTKVESKWRWTPFNNPARSDNLTLYHWIKQEDSEKEYEYAQHNKQINLIHYTDEEYTEIQQAESSDWSREETDYLWSLCEQFDLRFIVIHDRYDRDRTIEELKNRYYSLARQILEKRKIFDHPIIKSGYNYEQEMQRRACLDRIINRSNEETQKSAVFIKDAINNYKKCEDMEKMKKDLDLILSKDKFENLNLEDYLTANLKNRESFVFARSMKLYYPLPINEVILKKVDGYLSKMNLPDRLVPTKKVEASFDALKTKLIIYSILTKHIEKRKNDKEKLNTRIQELEADLHSKKVVSEYSSTAEWSATRKRQSRPAPSRSSRKRTRKDDEDSESAVGVVRKKRT